MVFLLLPFLVLGAVLMLVFAALVLMIAPPMVSALAGAVLALIALWFIVRGVSRRRDNGSDGEASFLPSARAKGGLL